MNYSDFTKATTIRVSDNSGCQDTFTLFQPTSSILYWLLHC